MFDLGLGPNELLVRRLGREPRQDTVRAAMRPDLEPGRDHRPNLVPVEKEPALLEERSPEVHLRAEVTDQLLDDVFITQGFHSFDQRIEVVRTERSTPREPSQFVAHGTRVGSKCELVSQRTRHVRAGEQISELGMPESTVCTDEIGREVDGCWKTVSAKNGKGEIVVVAPAVVEGDDAPRTGGPDDVCVLEKSAERNDLEVLFQNSQLALEGRSSHHHARLGIVERLIPRFGHTVIRENDHRMAFGPGAEPALPQPSTDQGLAEDGFSEALRAHVPDLLG